MGRRKNPEKQAALLPLKLEFINKINRKIGVTSTRLSGMMGVAKEELHREFKKILENIEEKIMENTHDPNTCLVEGKNYIKELDKRGYVKEYTFDFTTTMLLISKEDDLIRLMIIRRWMELEGWVANREDAREGCKKLTEAMMRKYENPDYPAMMDCINLLVFGMRASTWNENKTPGKGNLRDEADELELKLIRKLEDTATDLIYGGYSLVEVGKILINIAQAFRKMNSMQIRDLFGGNKQGMITWMNEDRG